MHHPYLQYKENLLFDQLFDQITAPLTTRTTSAGEVSGGNSINQATPRVDAIVTELNQRNY